MYFDWYLGGGDILVNHYQIPHTLNEEHLNWYIIKFAAILKIQYSLSFRNINFLIALKMWFQDHLLISKCKGNWGNFSTYNWEYTSLLATGNGAECGLNLRGLTALMYIWQHHLYKIKLLNKFIEVSIFCIFFIFLDLFKAEWMTQASLTKWSPQ